MLVAIGVLRRRTGGWCGISRLPLLQLVVPQWLVGLSFTRRRIGQLRFERLRSSRAFPIVMSFMALTDQLRGRLEMPFLVSLLPSWSARLKPLKNGVSKRQNGVRFTYPVSVMDLALAGRCAGRTPAKRWVLASTIARKASRP